MRPIFWLIAVGLIRTWCLILGILRWLILAVCWISFIIRISWVCWIAGISRILWICWIFRCVLWHNINLHKYFYINVVLLFCLILFIHENAFNYCFVKLKKPCNYARLINVRDKIRTRDLLVRSQTLYPAELHVLPKHLSLIHIWRCRR